MGKGKIQVKQNLVHAKNAESVDTIQNEINHFGGFQEQYDQLAKFRDELIKYVHWISPNRNLFRPKITTLETGDILDWHVMGYFAPLDFKRISWGGTEEHHQSMLFI